MVDLCANTDGFQSAKSYDVKREMRPRLPTTDPVSGEDYRRMVLAFVERTMMEERAPPPHRCAGCGKVLAA